MQITNKYGKKYISEIRHHLKCSGKLRRGFLEIFKNELYNFELNNPHALYSDYIAAFGTPEAAAEAYLAELSRKERAAYWLPFAAVLGAVFVSAFVFVSVLLIAQQQDRGSYMVESEVCVVSSSDIFGDYDD